MKTYEFDLSDCVSPEDIHGVILERLPLPEYYGGNLDALYDVLTDPHEPWRRVFTGMDTARAIVGAKYMRQFEKLCRRAAEDNDSLEEFFGSMNKD